MRGDSLRDFYAKSIALLGLGLLGGIGAAVDYWPTGVTMPNTARIDMRAASARPMSVGAWPDLSDVAPARASRTLAAMPPRPLMQHAAFRTVSFIPVAPAPAPSSQLELAAPSTFTGISSISEATLELTALKASDVFTITTVAPAPSNQKSVIATLVGPLKESSTKAGSAVANGFQAVGSAMKAGAVGAFRLLPGFGRHDDKQRQNRTILN